MNLSKVYRGTEVADIREFHFGSFGDVKGTSSSPSGFTADKVRTAKAESVSASPALTRKDLDEACNRGRQEALAGAAGKLETAAQALAEALEEVDRLRRTLMDNSRRDMLRLVTAIAEQVIRREVSMASDVIVTVIEQALKASVRADHYRIKVNPADIHTVTEQKPLFLASISGLKNLIIEGDTSISPGGCRVESDLGEVDATLETQLETIRQALDEALTGSP